MYLKTDAAERNIISLATSRAYRPRFASEGACVTGAAVTGSLERLAVVTPREILTGFAELVGRSVSGGGGGRPGSGQWAVSDRGRPEIRVGQRLG